MNEVHIERLKVIAKHLRDGELGHAVFDLNFWNDSFDSEGTKVEIPEECGTVGCPIGECPIVWPENWVFNEKGKPVLKRKPKCLSGVHDVIADTAYWFGLTMDEAEYLFMPDFYPREQHKSKKPVAVRIEKFIGKKLNWKRALPLRTASEENSE